MSDLPPNRPFDEPFDETPEEPSGQEELSTDDYADSAWRAAKFSCLFPPLLLLTLYLIVQAARAAGVHPPADPYAFRHRLRQAFLLGVLIPIGLIAMVVVLAAPRG